MTKTTKPRIIVNNKTSLSDADALQRVARVISGGRVSGNGLHYCYVTAWPDGIEVLAHRNMISDTFTVVQKKDEADE